ncbi:MAG: carbohydrate porin [Pseudomonadota bacterium]
MGLICSAPLLNDGSARADDTPNPLFDRPALFDGPGTLRQSLREAGIDIRASWTQFYQGVIEGEGDREWEFGGKGDIIVNLDGERLGLWPGFSVNIHQEFVDGNDINDLDNGSFIPVNTALAFPRLGGFDYDTSIVFTQTFGPTFTLSAGKFNMLDAAARTPLLGGGGLDTFMNLGLAAPVSGVTPPYIVGASLGVNTEPVSFSFLLYDPRNAQDWDVVTHPFAEGVTFSASATLRTQIFDLPGIYTLRGVVSTDEDLDLSDVPQILLPPDFQDEIGTASDPWYVGISAQQYLWQDPENPGNGWGIFGQLAFSDGNPTPVQSSAILGVGGNSMIPGRSDDRWGIAYFRYDLSNDLLDALAEPPFNEILGPEEGIEAYYNFAVTPWLRVTADLQWINAFPGESEDAIFAGLRTQVRF